MDRVDLTGIEVFYLFAGFVKIEVSVITGPGLVSSNNYMRSYSINWRSKKLSLKSKRFSCSIHCLQVFWLLVTAVSDM